MIVVTGFHNSVHFSVLYIHNIYIVYIYFCVFYIHNIYIYIYIFACFIHTIDILCVYISSRFVERKKTLQVSYLWRKIFSISLYFNTDILMIFLSEEMLRTGLEEVTSVARETSTSRQNGNLIENTP